MPAVTKWIAPLAIAVAIAAAAGANAATPVSVGHSGWFWGSPQPQGNTLNAVAFAGARGYAVGTTGTVLRSDDAGASWTGLGAGTYAPLSLVQTLGPNTVFVAGDCTLRRSDNGGLTFRRLAVTTSDAKCPSNIAGVSFVSSAVGYVLLANGTVLRTTDGGKSFGQRTAVPAGNSGTGNTDIDFVSADVGLAVAGGRIVRTTNGGGSWTAVTETGAISKVTFSDASHATAVGSSGAFLTSADGGVTFTDRPLQGSGGVRVFTGVSCADPQTCVVSLPANQVLRTTDGGATASVVTAAGGVLNGAAFASANRVVAVGSGGLTAASDDAGASFQPVGSILPQTFGPIRAAGGGRAYSLSESGRVARTLDGGRSWDSFGVPTGERIADVSFPTPAVGYALDADGGAFRTVNAGESWGILDPGVEHAGALIATSVDRVAVVGPRGVRYSRNGGGSFATSTSKAVRRAALGHADAAGRTIIAWGGKAVARSADGGRRWSRVRTPRGRIVSVDFVSARRGFLAQSSGRVYGTTNGGRRWRRITTVGGRVDRVAFGDARHGFALVHGQSSVIRTDDGGRTWELQYFSASPTSIGASGSKLAFASAVNGVFATATGGHLARSSRLSLRVSKRRLRRAGTVRVFGRLRPASGGSTVSVVMRRGSRFTSKDTVVASNGSFSASFRVRGSAAFVAQWAGDDRLDGDGTAEVKVKVGRR